MRIVAMSDTHMRHDDLVVPDGDVLVHAGDMTRTGSLDQLAACTDFLRQCPHRHKIVIAGNHERCLEKHPHEARALLASLTYLQDDEVVIEGVKFYGTPWQPAFHSWAFNLPRGKDLAEQWARIPNDTDVLVTHGPPMGIGDVVEYEDHAGCADLLHRVLTVKPKLHMFGHIHGNRGQWTLGGVMFASTDEGGAPVTVIEFRP